VILLLTPARTLVMSSTRIPESGNMSASLPWFTEAKDLRKLLHLHALASRLDALSKVKAMINDIFKFN